MLTIFMLTRKKTQPIRSLSLFQSTAGFVGINPNRSLGRICLDLLLPSCFLTALVRLPTSALPFHLAVARYAFDETSAHLLNNRTKSVKDSNDRFGLKILYVDNAKSYDQYVLKTQNYGMRKQNTLYWSCNTGCFGIAI